MTVRYRFSVSELYVILSNIDVDIVAEQLFNGQRQRFFKISETAAQVTRNHIHKMHIHIHTQLQ